MARNKAATNKRINPRTPAEWQEAVDFAEFLLTLHSAKLYGLVKGGPDVNVDRCERMLVDGKSKGYTPSKGCVERYARQLSKDLRPA